MTIRKVRGPGRPTGRQYDNAEIAKRYRARMKKNGVVELRGVRPSKSELVVFDRLAEVLGYGSRNEMVICELLKLGKAHGINPVREVA